MKQPDKRRRPTRLASIPLALLIASSCSDGGSSGPVFGINRRTVVQGLTFPTGLPQPGPVQTVLAFPNLSFDQPLYLGAPPDGTDRIVVGQQNGLILIFANDPQVTTTSTFLDLRGTVLFGGEMGLMGLAFHPDYANNGTFYLNYVADNPRHTVISRWQVSADPNAADPGSEQVLLTYDQPFSNHNAGCMAFGPDGMLYVASGDGGSGNDPNNNAQDLTTLLGNILRLRDDGSIPPDNPFVGAGGGARGEIWAYGMRNPWRMSFDRTTGQLWVGDVGQNAEEEVDVIVKGGNYGWRIYEGSLSNINPGNLPPNAFAQPVQSYPHSMGTSVTGGYVYRGPTALTLVGAYVYADFVSGRVWALVHDGSRTISNIEITSLPNPASFGEDEAGELYACCFDGNIYRLQDGGGGGGGAVIPPTLSATGLFQDVVDLRASPGVIEYEVNAPLWSDGAAKRRWIAVPGTSTIGFDPTGAWSFPTGTVLVKHFEIDTAPGVTKRLETRVLLRHANGWQGYTYRWNAGGTEADLLANSETETFTVTGPGGGQLQQTWYYPSSADCLSCHTAASGRVLGVRTRQVNRDHDYGLAEDNQLRAWNHIGLFDTDIGSHANYDALPDPLDATQPLPARARAYLASNCAHCHRPGGPTPVDLDLRYGLTSAQLNALGIPSVNPPGGGPGTLRIDPGSKEQSDLWDRLRRRDIVTGCEIIQIHCTDP